MNSFLFYEVQMCVAHGQIQSQLLHRSLITLDLILTNAAIM